MAPTSEDKSLTPKSKTKPARPKVIPYGTYTHHARVRKMCYKRGLSLCSPVSRGLAAAIDYLLGEGIMGAVYSSEDSKMMTIRPRDLMATINADPELKELFKGCSFAHSGNIFDVLPCALSAKDTKNEKKKAKQLESAQRLAIDAKKAADEAAENLEKLK